MFRSAQEATDWADRFNNGGLLDVTCTIRRYGVTFYKLYMKRPVGKRLDTFAEAEAYIDSQAHNDGTFEIAYCQGQ